MLVKLRRASCTAIAVGVVGFFIVCLVAVVMNVYNQPGRDQAESNQKETNAILATGQQKTPYFGVNGSPTTVTIVARPGLRSPYEALSPDVQMQADSHCTIYPTGSFSRIGKVLVGKRLLVSYDKPIDSGNPNECPRDSSILWGVKQPGLGSAAGVTSDTTQVVKG